MVVDVDTAGCNSVHAVVLWSWVVPDTEHPERGLVFNGAPFLFSSDTRTQPVVLRRLVGPQG